VTQYQGKNLMARWSLVVACLLVTASVDSFQTSGASPARKPLRVRGC
jgi:hypothetical protein